MAFFTSLPEIAAPWSLPIPAYEVWYYAEESIPLPPDATAAEEVAEQAEAAADDALAAAEPEPAPAIEVAPETPSETAEVHPPQLAGLY